MRRRAFPLAILLCGLALAAPASSALAAGSPVVADCNAHGQLTRHYSSAQLKSALGTLPADIKEYTNCYDVIQRQLLAQLGRSGSGAGGSSGSGGSFLPAPVLVLLILVVLGGAGYAALAARRRAQ
ncbi:MAG: hypothetical protein ACYC91_13745 [Solirubrobacteraceae bacterium]